LLKSGQKLIAQAGELTIQKVGKVGSMGTDINYFAERYEAGRWVPAFAESPGATTGHEIYHGDKFYFGGDRNYELFEILAGIVDTRTGLTTRGFRPISSPRGLPTDLSAVIAQLAAETKTYRHSWLLLQELIRFPWHDTFRAFSGYLNAENYRKFMAGEPYQWKQVDPPHPRQIVREAKPEKFPLPEWQVISNQEMQERVRTGGHHQAADLQAALRRMELGEKRELVPDSLTHLWTLVEYSESYAGPGQGILEDTIPKLRLLGPPEQVRVVFWFTI
jgi:hypothetical protein